MKRKPQFFAYYKDFNTGEMRQVDVLEVIFKELLTTKGKVRKQIRVRLSDREQLYHFIKSALMYHYWSKCEWEFVVIDWPYRKDSIEKSRPVKMDVYDQIKPNLNLIVDLVEDYIRYRF